MARFPALAAALMLATGASAAPQTDFTWECRITSSSDCSSGSCRATGIRGRLLIYPGQGLYWRCKTASLLLSDCAQYQVKVGSAGRYQTFDLVGAHGFASLGPDLTFTEAFAVPGENTIIAGRCHEAPPVVMITPTMPR